MWIIDFFIAIGKTVWEISEEGGGDPNNSWLELFEAIGYTSFNFFKDLLCSGCSDGTEQWIDSNGTTDLTVCNDCAEVVEAVDWVAVKNGDIITEAAHSFPPELVEPMGNFFTHGTDFMTITSSAVIFLSLIALCRIIIWILKLTYKFLRMIFCV
jgi:hypothetical protein